VPGALLLLLLLQVALLLLHRSCLLLLLVVVGRCRHRCCLLLLLLLVLSRVHGLHSARGPRQHSSWWHTRHTIGGHNRRHARVHSHTTRVHIVTSRDGSCGWELAWNSTRCHCYCHVRRVRPHRHTWAGQHGTCC
jgi:hypothetical protein